MQFVMFHFEYISNINTLVSRLTEIAWEICHDSIQLVMQQN